MSNKFYSNKKKTLVLELVAWLIYPCIFISDAILNMVNNIAANVLGGKQELEDGGQLEGKVF